MSILSGLRFLILSEFILQTKDQPLIRSYKFLSMSLYSYMKTSYQNTIIFNIVVFWKGTNNYHMIMTTSRPWCLSDFVFKHQTHFIPKNCVCTFLYNNSSVILIFFLWSLRLILLVSMNCIAVSTGNDWSVWHHIMTFNNDKKDNVSFEGLDIHYH